MAKASARTSDAVLATGSTIRGRITGEGDLAIDGVVEGDVSVRGRVSVSESGAVRGNGLSGTEVEIMGEVSADVTSDGPITVHASAVVRGGLKGRSLRVHEGASIAADFDADFELPEELRGRSR